MIDYFYVTDYYASLDIGKILL